MMTRIRIQATSEQPEDPKHATLKYTLLDSSSSNSRRLTIPVPHSFIADEIRWYLEEYAQKNPLDGGRAADARDALREHARDLAFWLHRSNVVPDVAALRGALILEVVEDGFMPNRLLWEVLEHREAVPALAGLDSVIIGHVLETLKDDGQDDNDSVEDGPVGEEKGLEFNMLIVSSRLNFHSDIPHRLVADAVLGARAELQKYLDGMDFGGEKLDFSKIFKVEVVNPATFKAFEAHLERRGPGYFRFVHLDLHGVEDSESVKLGFMKVKNDGDAPECVPDNRSADEVAAVLQRYKVTSVILNACRSAKDTSRDMAIPRVLNAHGVDEVVAMSHSISSRGVFYFVTFVYSMLFYGCSLQFAVWYARRAMLRNCDRLSLLGTELQVMDHIVPRYYRSTRFTSAGSDISNDLKREIPETPRLEEKPDDFAVSSFGRDHDLLKLACLLLEGDRAVMVLGEPGIGKSILLSNLMHWWEFTEYVEGAHHVQLSQEKAFTVERMASDLHRKFNLPGSYSDLKALMTALRKKQCLVVIDSLESLNVEKTTTVRDQRLQIRDFVKGLRGGQTVVAIASREEDRFLLRYTTPLYLRGLEKIPAVQLMRSVLKAARMVALQAREKDTFARKLADATMANLGVDLDSELGREIMAARQDEKRALSFASWETEEDSVYLEEIHKLVDGHPLALIELINYLVALGPSVTPKDYFHGLLRGNPMVVLSELGPREFLAEQGLDGEGRRSLTEAFEIVGQFVNKHHDLVNSLLSGMILFWKIIPRKYLPLLDQLRRQEEKMQPKTEPDVDWNVIEQRLKSGELDERMKEMGLDRSSMIIFVEELKKQSIPDRTVLPEETDFVEVVKKFFSHEGQLALRPTIEQQLPGLMEAFPQAANEIRDVLSGWETVDDVSKFFIPIVKPDLADPLQQLLDLQQRVEQDGFEMFKARGFIRELLPQELPSEVAVMQYYRISPLLTIVLRAQTPWFEDEKLVNRCRVAHALLYTHRCYDWPFPSIFSNSSKIVEARTVADLEFYNIASAVAAGQLIFHDTPRGSIIENCMTMLVMVIEWGLATDATRLPTVLMLWETYLEQLEGQMKELEKSPKRPKQPGKIKSFFRSKDDSKAQITEEQYQTEMQLSTRRRACLALSGSLLKFYTHLEDNRRNKRRDSIRYIVKGLKNDTHPMLKEITDSFLPTMDFFIHYADSTVSYFPFSLRSALAKLNLIVQDELMPSFMAETWSSFDYKDPKQVAERMQDLSQYATIATFNETVQNLWKEHQAGRHDNALRLLESAFEQEMAHGQNDPGRRSTLLFFRFAIAHKQERFTDALRDLEECQRLHDISSQTSSFTPWRRFMGCMRRLLIWEIRIEEMQSVKLAMVPCSGCGLAKAIRRCLGCLYAGYCSTTCQKNNWKEHRTTCKSIFAGYCI